MKPLRTLGFAFALVLAAALARAQETLPSKPLTREQQERLKERGSLWTEAQKLQKAGRLTEAVAAIEKLLLIQRSVYGDIDGGVAFALDYLAQLHESRDDLAAAQKAWQEVQVIQTKLRGEKHWKVADARQVLDYLDHLGRLDADQRRQLREAKQLHSQGEALYHQGQFPQALAAAQQVLAIRERLLGKRFAVYATSLNNLAQVYQAQGENDRAEPLFRQALDIYQQVVGKYHPGYATSLHNLAGVHEARGEIARAESLYREALEIKKRTLTEKHFSYAITLNGLALLYENRGELARAEPLLRQALEITRQIRGEKHSAYATILNNLAGLHQTQGQYAQAELLFRQSLQLQKELLGENHPNYAATLINLAGVYRELGQYARAEPMFHQALKIHKELVGEKDPAYATGLNNLASLYEAQGKYARAEPLYLQVRQLRKQTLGEKHPDYAAALSNLGGLYREQGDYARAETLFREALTLRHKIVGESHPDYANSLNNMAGLYVAQGDTAKAAPLLLQSTAIVRQVLGDKHPLYATSLNNLAEVYSEQGDYARAEPLYRQVLEICRRELGRNHPLYAKGLTNLAHLYRTQREHARAEPLLRQAHEIKRLLLGDKHPDYAFSLNTLAELYQERGQHALAEPLYRQALEVYRQAVGEKHPDYAACLNNLGGVQESRGNAAQAESLFRQALEKKKVLGPKHPDYAMGLNNLALFYASRGDAAQAETLLQQGIRTCLEPAAAEPVPLRQLAPETLRPSPLILLLLTNQGLLAEANSGLLAGAAQVREGEHWYALACGMLERLRDENLDHPKSKLLHGERWFDLFPRRLGLLQQLHAREGKVDDLEAAFRTAEQATARVFLEALGKARCQLLGGVSLRLRTREEELLRTLRQLNCRIAKEEERPLVKRNTAQLAELLANRQAADARLHRLIREMEAEHPQYAALKYPRPCTVAEARACLRPDEVALLYLLGKEASYVLLLEAHPAKDDPNNGLAICRLPPAEAITAKVDALTDVETLSKPARVSALGAELYAMLLSPVAPRIQGKHLVIVPSGALGHLPFELLVPSGTPSYLVERHRLRYAPSLTVLHLLRRWEALRPRPDRILWAAGDPVYDGLDTRLPKKVDRSPASWQVLAEYLRRMRDDGGKYVRLPFSGQELQAIRAVLEAPAEDVRIGLDASEEAVKEVSAKQLLARYRYIHFAAHGILGLDTGRQPSLILSLMGPDGRQDDMGINDGFLQLDEVTRLRLNADLVVLSACRSGQGTMSAGEGVQSLGRAFMYAGSRGVLVSLWSVADQETTTLMTDVYRQLQKGKSAPDALRAAQLAMIQAGKAPRYWAPFILIGE